MRGCRGVAKSLALSLGTLLLFVPPVAAQTWYESYHEAEEALENQSFSEAIRYLNDALEQRLESSARVRTYGMRFISYFPFLKLGIAYQHLGQADAALQAFETEERQGEIQRSEEGYAELRTYRDTILRTRTRAEVERGRRTQRIVAENMEAAGELEKQGRFDDALDALGKVLAVSPDLPEAQTARQRLLALVADRHRERELDERVARLLDQGRADLSTGNYRRAVSTLSQALELRPTTRCRPFWSRRRRESGPKSNLGRAVTNRGAWSMRV